MNNQKGFTLVEMMVVLLIISILLVITIPNITKHNSTINNKGCSALEKMIEAQVQAYEMDIGKPPASLNDLKTSGYINEEQTTCPNGKPVTLSFVAEE